MIVTPDCGAVQHAERIGVYPRQRCSLHEPFTPAHKALRFTKHKLGVRARFRTLENFSVAHPLPIPDDVGGLTHQVGPGGAVLVGDSVCVITVGDVVSVDVTVTGGGVSWCPHPARSSAA